MATIYGRTKKVSARQETALARAVKAGGELIGKRILDSVRGCNDGSVQASSSLSESINHPSHYNLGKIEVIDAIEDWRLGFHLGNVVKYVVRADHKGNRLEDLKKAAWYLNRAIEKG